MTVQLKDPDATLDYTMDWSDWLVEDTISTSVWTVPTGITKTSSSSTTTTATIWLSGGSAGQSYVIRNRITTAGGRTDDRSFVVRIHQR